MNRRELFRRAAAIGLVIPTLEPLQRFWPGWRAPKEIGAFGSDDPITGDFVMTTVYDDGTKAVVVTPRNKTIRTITMSTYARTAGPRDLPGWVRRPDLDPADGLRWMWSRDIEFVDGRRVDQVGWTR